MHFTIMIEIDNVSTIKSKLSLIYTLGDAIS